MEIREDAWLHAPGLEMIAARAARMKVTPEVAFLAIEEERARVLDRMKEDPYRFELEPAIWLVSDALEDFPYCTVDTERMLAARFGWTWKEFKARMREHLGFSRPVRSILDAGANRSSKSRRACKRAVMMAAKAKAGMQVMLVHETEARSRTEQQAAVWQLLPKEWRVTQKTMGAWIHYNTQNGFSNNKATLPNLAQILFHSYTQEVSQTVEGSKPIRANLDEAFTLPWLESVERRCAQFDGVVHCTFTPVGGWTEGIAAFVDGATWVKTLPAYLLPKDGDAPLPWLAMGLTQAEYAELDAAALEGRPATVPWSRPQDCLAWLEGKTGLPPTPAGRVFDVVPRVSKCRNPERAVVYYQPCDNPHGNPRNVIRKALAQGTEMVKRAVYAQVTKRWMSAFPKFDEAKQGVEDSEIPAGGKNYLMLDPAPGRNNFLVWIRRVNKKTWIYREWPGSYHIPGVGVPEEWAIPSSRNSERGNDGDRGGAQRGWGFSLLRMKFEIARLEGWADWKEWAEQGRGPDEVAEFEEIEKWAPRGGDGGQGASSPAEAQRRRVESSVEMDNEVMEMRYVDARPASAERMEHDRVTTLHTDLLDLNMEWALSPANLIADGVQGINSAIEMDTLRVAKSCRNVIYALKNYTGADGEKGACKDPVDCLRWFFTAGLDTDDGGAEETGDGDGDGVEGGAWRVRGERWPAEARRRGGGEEGNGVSFEGR